jgi:hypothetical protein
VLVIAGTGVVSVMFVIEPWYSVVCSGDRGGAV